MMCLGPVAGGHTQEDRRIPSEKSMAEAGMRGQKTDRGGSHAAFTSQNNREMKGAGPSAGSGSSWSHNVEVGGRGWNSIVRELTDYHGSTYVCSQHSENGGRNFKCIRSFLLGCTMNSRPARDTQACPNK